MRSSSYIRLHLRIKPYRQLKFIKNVKLFNTDYGKFKSIGSVVNKRFQFKFISNKIEALKTPRMSFGRGMLMYFAKKKPWLKKDFYSAYYKKLFFLFRDYIFLGNDSDYIGIFLTFFYGLIGRRRQAMFIFYGYLTGKLTGDEAYQELVDYAQKIDKNRFKGFLGSEDPQDERLTEDDPQSEYYDYNIENWQNLKLKYSNKKQFKELRLKSLPDQQTYVKMTGINYYVRFNYILKSMFKKGWITKEQWDNLLYNIKYSKK